MTFPLAPSDVTKISTTRIGCTVAPDSTPRRVYPTVRHSFCAAKGSLLYKGKIEESPLIPPPPFGTYSCGSLHDQGYARIDGPSSTYISLATCLQRERSAKNPYTRYREDAVRKWNCFLTPWFVYNIHAVRSTQVSIGNNRVIQQQIVEVCKASPLLNVRHQC